MEALNNGWIKLHRSFLDWEWYQDANTARLFLYCLLKANHEDKKWQGKEIKRGSFITSYEKLSAGTGLSKKAVRTALNHLISTHEVAKCSNSKYTIITIQNYDKYQEVGTPKDKQRASKGQAKGKQGATNKNEKNEKNEKNTLLREDSLTLSKRAYGSFQNVMLSSKEYQKLMERFPDYQDKIENLSEYLASTGKVYKSHYAVILNWARKDEFKMLPKKREVGGIDIF